MGIRQLSEARAFSTCLYVATVFVLALGLAACGSEDTSSAQSCEFDSDCELGTVCNYQEKCISAPCEDCEDDPSRICLVNDENPDGVCSRPECSGDSDCDTDAGETCSDGVCTTDGGGGDDCTNDSDCDDGEECNLANECVPSEDDDCEVNDDCDDGEYCDPDTNECEVGECANSIDCEDDEICDDNNECVVDGGEEDCSVDSDCADGEVCNADNQCEADESSACDPECTGSEVCDETTGECIENECPPGTPSPDDCASDPEYNKFDAEGCFCAQCLDDSDCDTDAGETCNSNGECFACAPENECDPADGGDACAQEDYYCSSNCCVECLGNTDCADGEVCVDGSCGEAPDCSVDPSVCTGNLVCDPDTNTCVPPETGTDCSDDPNACPEGTFCDSTTGECQDLTGGGGGGTCDPACPSGDCIFGEMCTCPSDGNPLDTSLCPSGEVCIFGMCAAL